MNTNRIAVAQAMALALALAMPGCSGGELGSVPTFIALQSDFAPYRSWTRVALGDAPLEGHPPGPRFGFVKDKAPRGAAQYPLGSIIVKSVEAGAQAEWELFGMVKRGGKFNTSGATDWEFFLLRLSDDGTPVVVARGQRPMEPGDGAILSGYGAIAGVVGCNLCHGNGASAKTDHILSPLLAPGVL